MTKFKAAFTNKSDPQDTHIAWFDTTEAANARQVEINGRGDLMPEQYDFTVEDKSYELALKQCYEQRLAEYPPLGDLADAIVKDDEAALKAYKEACLEVKKRYPKPEAI